jgi:phospholipid-binding lipoprotein MlaA
MKKRIARGATAAVLGALLLSGCASTAGVGGDPRDPFESYNRSMFAFNDALDSAIVKPVALKYVDYLPEFVRMGVNNFFGNLGDVWTAVNNYLQLKPVQGTQDAARVIFNTTFGLAGLIDFATPMGLPKHEEDFGQTLAVWGVKSGPYLVLPFFGASTLRDGLAKPVDLYADPLNQFDSEPFRNGGRILRVVDTRAELLGASSLMEDIALDRYQFLRDAYLQRREWRIRDGEPAPENPHD